MRHSPSFIPDADKVSSGFSMKGLVRTENKDVFAFALISSLGIVMYFLAILYRWNIKAGVSIWWPISLVFKNSIWNPGSEGQDLREKTAELSSNSLRWFYFALSIFVGAWLSIAILPTDWVVEVHRQTPYLKLLPAPPSFGLRFLFLSLQAILVFILFWVSLRVRASHDKALTGAKDYRDYSEAEKRFFEKKAMPVHVMLRLNFVCFFLFINSVFLYSVTKIRPDLGNVLLWQWIRPLL